MKQSSAQTAPSKHTPGPWSADWDDNGQWYVNIGGLSVSGNALRGDSGECVESANARLISAAPELLEALLARSIILGLPPEDDHEGCIRAARKLTAKTLLKVYGGAR